MKLLDGSAPSGVRPPPSTSGLVVLHDAADDVDSDGAVEVHFDADMTLRMPAATMLGGTAGAAEVTIPIDVDDTADELVSANPPPRDGDVITIAPPSGRALLQICASILLLAGIVSVFFEVEQTGNARGVLRFVDGSQTLASQATGTIAEVKVHSGDSVVPGQILATFDSAAGQAALLDAERAVRRAERVVGDFKRVRVPLYDRRQALLERRVVLLTARAASHGGTRGRLDTKVATYDKLKVEGLNSTLDTLAVRDELATAERDQIKSYEDVVQTQIDIATIQQDRALEETKLETDLEAARDHEASVRRGLEQSAIRASSACRVESVLVRPGDAVLPGAPVARIFPNDAPQQIVAFSPERDRGFLVPGTEARVELDQFSPSEFGWLTASVTLVGGDLAAKAELKDIFGDTAHEADGALHRVELSLANVPQETPLRSKLHPGSAVTVRYVLRRQRIVFLFLDPLREYFQ